MTGKPSWLRVSAMAIAFAAAIYGAVPAPAADIIADWPNVKMPPPPELKPVTLDGKTTALFILDLQAPSCTMAQRPHCVELDPEDQSCDGPGSCNQRDVSLCLTKPHNHYRRRSWPGSA